MRTSISALALIHCTMPTGELGWLTQWNVKWQALSMVGGHKHDDESFHACCVREIKEELSLHPERDYRVANQPRLHLEFDDWSRSAHEQTHYVLEIFDVELLHAAVVEAIQQSRENSWLTAAEIDAGRSTDGRAISPTVGRILRELGELTSEQSIGNDI